MRCTIMICANVIGIDARTRSCRDTFASSSRQKMPRQTVARRIRLEFLRYQSARSGHDTDKCEAVFRNAHTQPQREVADAIRQRTILVPRSLRRRTAAALGCRQGPVAGHGRGQLVTSPRAFLTRTASRTRTASCLERLLDLEQIEVVRLRPLSSTLPPRREQVARERQIQKPR